MVTLGEIYQLLKKIYREIKALRQLLENGAAIEPRRTLNLTTLEAVTDMPRKRLLAAIRDGELVAIEAGKRTKVVRPADLDAWLEWLEARS